MSSHNHQTDTVNTAKGTFTLSGTTWHTRPAIMRILGIRKSLFYILLSQGRILSHQPLQGVSLHVYRLPEATDAEGGKND